MMAHSSCLIEFRNVGMEHSEEKLFSGLSFCVKPGSKTVLTGASGSGKSTILKMMLGFVRPASGEIVVHGLGLSPKTIATIRQKSGYVPQMSSLGEGTIEEELLLPFRFAKNKGLRPTQECLYDHLNRLGLGPGILKKHAREISGGESQRLALLIVRLLERPLLLLDEPTSALDPASKKLVTDYLLSEPGLTVFSVSHDADWIAANERVLTMKEICTFLKEKES